MRRRSRIANASFLVEACDDSTDVDAVLDEDEDGSIDEGLDCCEAPGLTKPCGEGICADEQQCQLDLRWGPCLGEQNAVEEICDSEDNDCDGNTDEAGVCTEEVCDGEDNDGNGEIDALDECCARGETRQCGIDQGVCSLAIQECTNFIWGVCPGLVSQSEESCDGVPDEALNAPVANMTAGVCEAALQVCEGKGGFVEPNYGAIFGYEEEKATCDEFDNDCDTRIDEGFDFTSDPNNCGACNIVCEELNPNAPICGRSACRFQCKNSLVCDRGQRELCNTNEYCFPMEQTFQKADNISIGDRFGLAAATDGNRLVVGAPAETGNTHSTMEAPNDRLEGAGAVYVFERQPNGLHQSKQCV